jgi:tetratricopeptide (TPR) repeat protein
MTVLNFVDHLLARGRRYQELHQPRLALRVLGRLSGLRSLPGAETAEVQLRLAELHLEAKRFRKARRCLTAVLAGSPDNARAHYLMAVACRAEGRGDLKRAARHYRRSLELDGECVECLCEFGLLAVQSGQSDEGLACLCRAYELRPNDPEPLGRLVEGLCQAGQAEEARRVLRAALFRRPRDARFRRLWHDFQFQQLRQRQELDRLNAEQLGVAGEAPVLLPFVRVQPAEPTPDPIPTVVRRDPAGPLPGPHAGTPAPTDRLTPEPRAGA